VTNLALTGWGCYIHHFNALYKGMRLELKEAKVKAVDYLHQLSFASRVRDSAWADGLHL
jgi:hypothetical protein